MEVKYYQMPAAPVTVLLILLMQVIMEQLKKNPTQPKQTPIHNREIRELKLLTHVFQLVIRILVLAVLSVGLSWRIQCSETLFS